jgi:LmbE family N-acetylglucosaminyl deacetylase
MKTKQMSFILICLLITTLPMSISGQAGPIPRTDQPEQAEQKSQRAQQSSDDITKWTNKTIMWVGPHQDDESGSLGTLSLLKANGNKIIMVWYTTGNKGSRDLTMTSERLASIRKVESENACREMGITPEKDTFIWLGYDDGMLEYVPDLELTEKVCRLIRTYRPDAVFSMDPGTTWMKWHKTDHRASAFITLDAARAAAYFLYFPSHYTHEGLQPYTVRDYFFYSTGEANYQVDVTSVSDKKIRSRAWYVSQFGSGNLKYVGPDPDQESLKKQLASNADRIKKGEKVYERFRRLSESMSF